MTKLNKTIIALFLVTFFVSCHSKGYQKYENTKAPNFELPTVERVELDNGLVLHLLEDHELPIFKVTTFVRAGSIFETPDKVGETWVLSSMLKTGGTKNYTSEELDEKLDYLSSNLEVFFTEDRSRASLEALSQYWQESLKILLEILFEPAFDATKFDFSKKKIADRLYRANDDPGKVADYKFKQEVYGKDYPWGRRPTVKGINDIKRQDVIDFYARYFHPDRMIMAISGDFNSREVVEFIKKQTLNYKKSDTKLPDIAWPKEKAGTFVSYVDKDISQSTVLMGHLGINKDDQNKYALLLLNDIIGADGFWSRLKSKVRRERGLTYAIGSNVTWNDQLGIFKIYFNTKTEQTTNAMALVVDILNDIVKNGVTKEELKIAKESFINRTMMLYTTPEQIAVIKASLEFNGYPPDYVEDMVKRIKKLRVKDINRVAKQYINLNDLKFVVVGNSKVFEKDLAKFGKVEKVELEY